MGKLLADKPQYLKLINPLFWIKKAKKFTKKRWARVISLSVLLGGILFLVGSEIGIIVTRLWGPILSKQNVFTYIQSFSLPLFLLSITLIPIVEEWVFRGVILEEISKMSKSKVLALILSSLIFALFHLSNPGTYLTAVIPYFIGGMIIGGGYLLGGLSVAALCHIIYNLLPYLLFLLFS